MPSIEPRQVVARPSSSLVVMSPETKTTTATAPTKVKEIVVTHPGVYRVRFNLKGGAANIARGQVYRNGSPLGSIFDTPDTAWHSFSEELGGWQAGDLLQLYLWSISGAEASASGFSQWGEYALRPPDIPAGAINLA